jgi:hypothetical protein
MPEDALLACSNRTRTTMFSQTHRKLKTQGLLPDTRGNRCYEHARPSYDHVQSGRNLDGYPCGLAVLLYAWTLPVPPARAPARVHVADGCECAGTARSE